MKTVGLLIEGMHCASCVGRVEAALAGVPGVRAARVSLATEQAVVDLEGPEPVLSDLLGAVERAGYRAEFRDDEQADELESHRGRREREIASWRRRLILGGLATGVIVRFSMNPHNLAYGWAMFLLATPLQAWLGWPYYQGAWTRLRHGSANMDTLIAMGTTAAYGFSTAGLVLAQWFDDRSVGYHYFMDSAMILTLITLGKYLEVRARGRASEAVFQLLDLAPPTARVVRDGVERQVPASELAPGDLFVLRPGDRVPADAVVREGASAVDESAFTGESMPVAKSEGAAVTGGTINLDGRLLCEATRVGRDTALAQMVRVVRKAQESKADVQRLADRVSGLFVPSVLAVACATLVGWLVLGPEVGRWQSGVLSAIAVLIVACPCALGLATPTAIMVGSGRGASLGVLIKDAQALERAGAIDVIVLDKTGTITMGWPEVTDVVPSSAGEIPTLAVQTDRAINQEEVVRCAAAVESASEHPLARAVLELAEEWGIRPATPSAFQAVPGGGIRGRVGEDEIWVGTERLLADAGVAIDHLAARKGRLESEGKTVLYVARNGAAIGLLAMADKIKGSSLQAVEQLRRMGLGVYMLSGDNEPAARMVAARLGIDVARVFAPVRPEGKAEVVRGLQQAGHVVAMVGDGINDAPALVQADLGIALASGTGVAMEAGQIVLVSGDLAGVVRAIRLSRRTLRVIWQNLFGAFIYNVAAIPLAALGVLHPIVAAAAMAASSVTVVGNSLSLRRRSLGD